MISWLDRFRVKVMVTINLRLVHHSMFQIWILGEYISIYLMNDLSGISMLMVSRLDKVVNLSIQICEFCSMNICNTGSGKRNLKPLCHYVEARWTRLLRRCIIVIYHNAPTYHWGRGDLPRKKIYLNITILWYIALMNAYSSLSIFIIIFYLRLT